jgi:hypothetical protein
VYASSFTAYIVRLIEFNRGKVIEMNKMKLKENYDVGRERYQHFENKFRSLNKTSPEYERAKQKYLYHKKLAQRYQTLLND